jgi:hypothetical protein
MSATARIAPRTRRLRRGAQAPVPREHARFHVREPLCVRAYGTRSRRPRWTRSTTRRGGVS